MAENQTPQRERESASTRVTQTEIPEDNIKPNQTKSTPNRQKNPNKVAAGRAGAAARKLKQERLLKELQEAKQSMLSAEEPEDVKQPAEEPDPLSRPMRPEKQHSWTPFVLGGACLLGAYLYTISPRLMQPPPQQSIILQESNELKTDPFYME